LVFVLHSYGRYAKDHMQSLQLDSIAEINKFVVCYPQGTLDINTGEPYWTGGLATSSIDDVGYLTKLAKHLQTKYKLDTNLIRTELLFAAFPMELLCVIL
jgi:polyhydroxybutyrate depolymerase